MGSPEPSARITARSVAASPPTSVAPRVDPSVRVTARSVASYTTWLLVRTYPSGVKITPDPAPTTPAAAPGRRVPAALLTTAGPPRPTTQPTACESESRRPRPH